jgi:hypothetical protein
MADPDDGGRYPSFVAYERDVFVVLLGTRGRSPGPRGVVVMTEPRWAELYEIRDELERLVRLRWCGDGLSPEQAARFEALARREVELLTARRRSSRPRATKATLPPVPKFG